MKRLLVIGGENRYGRQMLSGIHSCFRNERWEYHLEGLKGAETTERSQFALKHWRPDAIVAQCRTQAMEKLVMQSGLPAVNFSGVLESSLPSVTTDHEMLGRMVAKHFLETGVRNFGFCARTNELSTRSRCKAYCEEIEAAGFSCNVFSDRVSGFTEVEWVGNRKRMDAWLVSLKKPVAIMCIHDQRAMELSWACRRLGLRVPDDVAIVGIGNDEFLCQICTPPLSSVNTDAHRIGYEAARMLQTMMSTGKRPTKPVLIPPRRLVARQSSDLIAIDDVEIAEALRFIRDHAHEPISVQDLLQEVPISRRSMERRFEKAMGRSPKAEIMRMRIHRAQELLCETDLPASTVAIQSGFTGLDKLCVAFRRECDTTPLRYRKVSRSNGQP